ncbi:class I SAM-dependent methyltransferase [Microbacterium sp. MM2322]|uniref:class I SAM-dependent methyltransferase n=1 Tax=Microbacterium sp. MM2322 TaxID=3157631 RepID=UPI0032D597EE
MTDYDPRIVDLYDIDNPDGPDHDFYRALADDREASTILDLGCGTGMLTVTLARDGRRVVGMDPSRSMLAFARARDGGDRVEWIEGDSTAAPPGPFDLVVMTGNVMQHISDDEWPRTLHDLHARMRSGGTVSFESRNPAFREWESWASEKPATRDTAHGSLTEWMDVEVVDDRIVRFRARNLFAVTGETITEEQSLVFRDRAELESDLRAAGFDVDRVDGDWGGTPFDGTSRLMIFVARAR